MLAHVIQADVAANYGTDFVLGLVHDLGVVGPVELGHGDTGSSQRVGCVAAAQLLLGNEVGVLGGHPPGSAASGKRLRLLSYRVEPNCRAATCVLQVSEATCRASASRASLCLRCWPGNGPLSLAANTLVPLAASASHKPGSCPALVGPVMGFSLQRSEKLR